MLITIKPTNDEIVPVYVNPLNILSVCEHKGDHYMTTSDGSDFKITQDSYERIVAWMERHDG